MGFYVCLHITHMGFVLVSQISWIRLMTGSPTLFFAAMYITQSIRSSLINALLISVRVMEEEIDVLVIVQYFWNPAASPIRIKDYDDNDDDDDDNEEDDDNDDNDDDDDDDGDDVDDDDDNDDDDDDDDDDGDDVDDDDEEEEDEKEKDGSTHMTKRRMEVHIWRCDTL